jgi:hypothetical protein
MRSIVAALAVGLAGSFLSGCVDEGSYTGPSRYPVERDYRRYDDYHRYDRPRYQRYEPVDPYYDRLPPPRRPAYERYPRYGRSDDRQPGYVRSSFDRPDFGRPDRERELGDRRRDEERREREADRRNRDRPIEIPNQGPNVEAARPEPSPPDGKPSLSVVCAPEDGNRKCRLKGNNAFRGD